MNRLGRRILVAAAALPICLGSCKALSDRADLEEFVDTGLTNVLVRSTAFSPCSTDMKLVPSAMPITCVVEIINPKGFDVEYSLACSVAGSYFSAAPDPNPTPSDSNLLSFAFTFNPAYAERKNITFSLGKYVASINKTYEPETFSITCDSPPNPPMRVATAIESAGQKSMLAVRLPVEISDEDISKLRISWRREDSATTRSDTYAKASLVTTPSSNPFASAYDCYFQAPDCEAGYGYEYSVVLIDDAGQESSAASTSSAANSFYVNYLGNGSTSGTAPASVGYRFASTAIAAGRGDLAMTNYAFDGWNTMADGSGTRVAPGAPLTIPAGDVNLYAQWVGNSTGISIGMPTSYQALTFADSAPSIVRGQAIGFETSNPTLDAVATGWTWYIDGVVQGESSRRLTLSSAATNAMLGSYLIAARVSYGGVSYSGNLILTVHR